MDFRFAEQCDVSVLAEMNAQLIGDEGHRNSMTGPELESRLAAWLTGEYRAVLFLESERVVGYALFRDEPEYVYLRQFFVVADCRRQGVGRAALDWLRQHAWAGARRLRIEVLAGNTTGIAFWRATGFHEYAWTMERSLR